MEGYKVTVANSLKEMNARERIAVKALDRATALDSVVQIGSSITLTVDNLVTLNVHNDKAKEGNNKDYTAYVIVADTGEKYRTGSESFYSAFMDIYDELKAEAPDEPITIEIYKQESKNFKGKGFISCSLV